MSVPRALRRFAAIVVAMMLLPARAPLSAQHHSSHSSVHEALDDAAIARFVAQARAGTERYRDRTVAIDEGFRLVGPDFPGMGEHWINVARLLSARFDPANPAMLQYAEIDGKPTLVAVTYALALVGGDSAPAFPSRALWHQHRNTVDEESLIDQHVLDDSHRAGGRIAMLHAWVWLENPGGLFQSDNWRLPFERLHLTPGAANTPSGAARALSLLSGGDVYHETAFAQIGGANGADSVAIRAAIARARTRADSVVKARRDNDGLVVGLSDVWRAMWDEMDATVRAEVRRNLLPVRNR
jgi:hypothetical protein